ncbi:MULTISPECIES: hypothetical protein [Bacillaceae]|uniref:hypothetical protein n=1 Tax=Bacillaceae TaxID=186817 RepID=UPI001BDEE3EB|nr:MULTISPECIES: hypothetical protein [Bacillaceae]MDX8360498.1 hypothetical protein [Cytobacillus sp. IB215316]
MGQFKVRSEKLIAELIKQGVKIELSKPRADLSSLKTFKEMTSKQSTIIHDW